MYSTKAMFEQLGVLNEGTPGNNNLPDRKGNLRFVLISFQSHHLGGFFFLSLERSHVFIITWSVVMDGSDSSSQMLYEYSLWRFLGAGCFL